MSRTRKSARDAGASMEREVARYLARHVDDRIERRTSNGVTDRGDIAGLRHMGERLVVECKNTGRLDLTGWAREAETERGNDDALAGLVVHKRHNNGEPADQWVTLTLADLVALLTGSRDHTEET